MKQNFAQFNKVLLNFARLNFGRFCLILQDAISKDLAQFGHILLNFARSCLILHDFA